jgi:hypothetical protein
MRPRIKHTAIALHLQLSWPQWIKNVSGSREIFTHSVIKELKQIKPSLLHESAKADAIAGKARTSDEGRSRSPISTGPSTSSSDTAFMKSGRLPSDRIQRATFRSSTLKEMPEREDSRVLSGPTVNNLINSFSEGNSFVTSVDRFREFTHKRSSDSAARSAWSPASPGIGVHRHAQLNDNVAGPLRKSAQATPLQSLLSQPALTNMPHNLLLRSRLFAESARLNLANQPLSPPAAQAESRETASSRQPDVVQPQQQQLDLGRLSDEVYRHIQRKIRIERERRGI